jgi:hypothetical protein
LNCIVENQDQEMDSGREDFEIKAILTKMLITQGYFLTEKHEISF